LEVLIDEFFGKGEINTVSLKRVFENAETSEPAQGGDSDPTESCSINTIKINK
jgi:hypothetical protein